MTRGERLFAEFAGTAFLLAAVVGSGIMAEALSGGSVGLALLANAFATAGVLYAIIAAFGPVSGAHFNPLVSLAMVWRGDLPKTDLAPYVAAQIAGAVLGVVIAHLMFGLPPLMEGVKPRSGASQFLAEIVASCGLLMIVLRVSAAQAPAAVACYIAGAYWFTASTSFANPAVTLARALTDSFAGIRPADVPAFIAAQAIGLGIAYFALRRAR